MSRALGNAAPASDADLRSEKLIMRLEIKQVDGLDLKPSPVLTGLWAWLLFHENGDLISYSDGYPTRSACHAAAKLIAWPIDVFG